MTEYQILDVNLNRAREALRVVEDFIRFKLKDSILQEQLKQFRALLGEIEQRYEKPLIQSRNAEEDIGREKDYSSRQNLNTMVIANLKRAQEACRVIEEILKLLKDTDFDRVKNIRYELYTIEKRIKEVTYNDAMGSSSAK